MRARNLEFLARVNGRRLAPLAGLPAAGLPPLEFTAAGLPTVQRDGRYRHSKYDPEQEAARLVAKYEPAPGTLAVIVGCGLGYAVRAWARRHPATVAVGIEAEPALLAAGLDHLDFTPLPAPPYLWAGPPDYRLKRLLAALLPDSLRVQVVEADPRGSDAARTVTQYLADLVAEKRQDLLTRWCFADRWLENIARNARAFLDAPGLDALGDRYRGVPALIIGAGPSLTAALPELKRAAGRVLLVATDTALRTLAAAGIRPDLVVSVDAQPENRRDFDGVETSDLTLAFEAAVDPEVVRRFRGRRLGFPRGHHQPQPDGSERLGLHPLIELFFRHAPPRPYLQGGGSVSHAAFDLARQLGCAPLVLVGQDLAYPGGTTHAADSYDVSAWREETDRFGTIEASAFRQLRRRERVAVPALGGGTIVTDPVFNQYRVWFEDAAGIVGVPCFNAGATGALIRGYAPISITELTARYGQPLPPRPAPAAAAPWDRAGLRRELARYHEELTRLAELAAAQETAARELDPARSASFARLHEARRTLTAALPPLLREALGELLWGLEHQPRPPAETAVVFFAGLHAKSRFLLEVIAELRREVGDDPARR